MKVWTVIAVQGEYDMQTTDILGVGLTRQDALNIICTHAGTLPTPRGANEYSANRISIESDYSRDYDARNVYYYTIEEIEVIDNGI